jgi:PAS domain S-box-containing protein
VRAEEPPRTHAGAAIAGWAVTVAAALALPEPAGVGLVAGGLASAVLAAPEPAWRRWVGRGLGLICVAAAAADLAAGSANRVAAVALILIGCAWASLDIGPAGTFRPTDLLAPMAGGVALAALLDQAYVWSGLPGVVPGVTMPPAAATLLLVLAVAAVLARPDRGVVHLLTGPAPSAVLFRHLAPLLLLPFGVVAVGALTQRLGGGTAVAATASTVLVAVVVAAAVVRAAGALDRVDARRSRRLAALREERDFADTLLRSMAESVVVLDPDLRVIEANQQWYELIGRSRDEVVGQAPPYPWQPSTPDALTPNPPYPRLSGPARDECVRRPDGSLVPVLTTRAAVPGPDGRPRAYVATYMDITAQKRSGDVMAEQAALLERVNQHLRQTNERLEQAAGFSSDLTALLSHEVAQPLTSIASLAELLVQGWEQLPDGTRFEVTGKIDRNARRLVQLVRDMLLLFQLDGGAVTTRRTPVVVADVVEAVASAHPDLGTDGVAPTVCALVDRGHLELVLTKLVDNAVAYGRPPVEVSCHRVADHVVIAVSDQGGGIPEDLRRRLFDRTVPPSTAAQGSARGRGLGLFIARHILDANEGAIWYEPGVPAGARLLVRLEAAALAAADGAQSSGMVAGSAPAGTVVGSARPASSTRPASSSWSADA